MYEEFIEKPEQVPHGVAGNESDGKGGMFLENDREIVHKGVVTFNQDTILSNQTYSSKESGEHAILVTRGVVTISGTEITKLGDAEGDFADFYGTNAAVISTDGILELNDVKVDTNGKHANAVFAYGSGEVDILDSTITTEKDNSGGIMVTGGGKLSANNVDVVTEGNSSAAIRSDRGGGNINVYGGKYITNGVGSPAIYSTADVVVDSAELKSTKSEGIIIEGKNSVFISNSILDDTNTTLNGHSTTYKNIFLYQSMSGDADEGMASFVASGCEINTNKGDTIYVTNTKADIVLEDNEIVNNDGDFLRIEGAAWGRQGSNGGDVNLSLINQDIGGNIVVDDISSLSMVLTEGSSLQGAINFDNQSKNISIKLDSSSTWILKSDSYVSEIYSEAEGYSNIDLNGYILYVGDMVITSLDQFGRSDEVGNITVQPAQSMDNSDTHFFSGLVIGLIGFAIFVVFVFLAIKFYLKKK